MSKTVETSRRSFLKSGALVAAPFAAIGVPAAAMAEDGSKAALARLQDERAIEALNRDFLRAFNQGGAKATEGLFANRATPSLAAQVSRLSVDMAQEAKSFVLADDGASAAAQFDCTVETSAALQGDATIVQMARMQGNTADSRAARKTLSARYVRHGEGWLITDLELV